SIKEAGAWVEGIKSRKNLDHASTTKGIAVLADRNPLIHHGDAGCIQVTICAGIVERRVRKKVGALADLLPVALTDEARNHRPAVVLGFGAVAVPDVPDVVDDVAVSGSAARIRPGCLPKSNDRLVGERVRCGRPHRE